jgi:tetratricopeptide (TPR) repeat protein
MTKAGLIEPSLGLSADWLLRTVVPADPPARVPVADCLRALSRHDRGMADAAARVVGLDADAWLQADADDGRSVARDELLEMAHSRARDGGRPVIAAADVAEALLAIARSVPVGSAEVLAARPGLALPATPAPLIQLIEPAPPPTAGRGIDLDDRVVRVFISSTFRDMHAERDELVKRVFPELRRLCRSRGVELVEVDLRWGITREQAERGEVLPVCLEEIQRCRPYFIGLLGERYGWIPSTIDAELLRAQPWLTADEPRSVTELEILYGALNNPAMADHTFFYFRDPAYLRSVEPARRPGYEPETPDAASRLAALKQRIRESGLPVREAYPDARALGTLVLDDLRVAIEAEYPEDSAPDVWEVERMGHATFARSRTRVYVQRPADFDRLDQHLRTGGPPLVLSGPAGSGKSALVANWLALVRAADRDDGTGATVVYHAVAATPLGGDHLRLARRIMVELVLDRLRRDPAAGGSTGWIDALDDADVSRNLAAMLRATSDRDRPLVLVLDGVDQLADVPGARELVWLPDDLPDDVRLVVTTRPGPSLEAFLRRGWAMGEVAPLDREARAALAEHYLWTTYRKRLEPTQVARIAAAPQTASPLFLRALLEELRVFGEFERVTERIEHYLAAPSVLELYALVLERLETDYEVDRPGLVGDSLAAIAAARRGLTEPELLGITGAPMATWSPLRLALEEALISRAGVLGLFHDELRRAVEARYLPDEAARIVAHRRLAAFFEAAEPDTRRAEELPFQVAEAGDWRHLAEILADPVLVDAVWLAESATLRAHWGAVREHTGITPVAAYRDYLEDRARWDEDASRPWHIALLLSTMGYAEEALPVLQALVEIARGRRDAGGIQATLGNLGFTLFKLNRPKEALACHREEEAICRNHGLGADLQKCLGNQVNVLRSLGRSDEALRVLDEAEALARRLNDPTELSHRLFQRAQALADLDDYDGARDAIFGAGRLLESLADREGLVMVAGLINDQGVARKNRGELDEAMVCYDEAERLSRKLGLSSTLQTTLINQGNILGRRRDYEAADARFAEAEAICRRLGARDDLLKCLFNRAMRRLEAGQAAEAVPLAEEAATLATELSATDLLPHVQHLLDTARSHLW